MKKLQRIIVCVMVIVMVLNPLSQIKAADLTVKTQMQDENYLSNQGELLKTPFIQLPVGAVKAREWLENQLLLQKTNLTGNMKKFPDYKLETSAWLNGTTGESWENGPYYMRGLVALAYVLDDAELKEEAQTWVEAVLKSQKASGVFGPGNETDWWGKMPVLMALRDYYEATEAAGDPDERIIPFMEKYFRFQEVKLPTNHLNNWADARGGDNIDSVYWLYNHIYNSASPQDSAWLLSLATLLESQTTDWTDQYNNTTVRQHVVNTSQGMKTPAVYYQYSKSESDKNALQNGLLNMSIDHGRIDGLPNSDEAPKDNRSTVGTENCGIVEGLLSSEIAQKVLGEAWIGDRLEQLAYNSLPAAYTPDYSGHVYYVLQNQVMATLGNHEFGNDHGDSSAFGAPLGFNCCFANTHMGWPKFVQNMWMATADGGLAVVAYGPNSVKAKVADGKNAMFLQETQYPFKDKVKLTYGGEEAAFELQLRIPAWAVEPVVKINGEVQTGIVSGDYYVIDRTWKSGDVIDLNFPSEIKTSTWYNDSVGVEKGPLLYGLKIKEDWRVCDDNDARELKVEHQEQSPLREVYPASDWNYGLVVNETNPAASFQITYADEVALQPFSSDTAPITIKAMGQLIPDWIYDGNLAGPQPYGPTAADESLQEEIELIPYGCGRLRISQFPKVGTPTDTVVKNAETDSSVITHLGTKYQEFDNVVVPMANGYTLKVKGSGSGMVTINNKYTQAIDLSTGEATIDTLEEKLTGGFKFTEGQFNNIRFTTNLKVDSMEVIPVNRTITSVKLTATSRTEEYIKLVTNLDAQETPYKVVYGTESGNYTNTVCGFESSTAYLTGLDKLKDYYVKVIATIRGVEKEGAELVFKASDIASGGLKPNPNVPVAEYANFPTLNYMDRDFKKFDPENKVTFVQNGGETNIRFEKGSKVKTALLPENTENEQYTLDWVDYVAETTISVDQVNTNNCGLMIRTTQIGDDPDAYHGYFVGIGHLNVNNLDGAPYSGPGLMIGYADGSWHDLKPVKVAVTPGQKYKLKVVAYGEQFAVYLDDVLVTTFTDTKFANGTVGLRAYNEAFTAYSLSVRPVVQDDLTIFNQGDTDPEEPVEEPGTVLMQDDFSDATASGTQWTKVPDTANINFANGEVALGSSTNIKLTNGSDTWANYVYEGDVKLGDGTGNAGFIFRSKNEGSGPDAYEGYYFGVGEGSYEIGKANNNWTKILSGVSAAKKGEAAHLKVIAYDSSISFYINEQYITTINDNTFAGGKIGLRGYNRAFSADNIKVRTLTLEEKEAILNPPLEKITASAVSFKKGIQIKYSKTNATSYKVQFGTESGNYTNEFVDVKFNTYGGKMVADKVAFSVPSDQQYYVRIVGLSGTAVIAASDEIVIETNQKASVSSDAVKLEAKLAQADIADISGFSATSRDRFETAMEFASKRKEQTNLNQMDLSLITSLLNISLKTNNSEDIIIDDTNPEITPTPTIVPTEKPTEAPTPTVAPTQTPVNTPAPTAAPSATVTPSAKPSAKPKITVKKVVVNYVKNTKGKTMVVSLKKVTSVKGYQVMYGTNKTFTKGKKLITTKSIKFSIKKLKKGRTYYLKVRAYKLDTKGKKVYGSYSSTKKVKITK